MLQRFYCFMMILVLSLAIPNVGLASPSDAVSIHGEIETGVIVNEKKTMLRTMGVLEFDAEVEVGGMFIGGEVHLNADPDTSEIDEIFIKLGNPLWDIQIGKVSPNSVYDIGQDLLFQNDIGYMVNYTNDLGSEGVNLNYKIPGMRLQLHLKDGVIRPWASWEIGDILVVSAAYEEINLPEFDKIIGYGVGVSGEVGPVALGVSYASSENGGLSENSIGGYADIDVMGGKAGLEAHQHMNEILMKQQTALIYYIIKPFVTEGATIGLGYEITKTGEDQVGEFQAKIKYQF